ncbi:AAA family ATPase [Gorillibacterium massiliense]|uniref:AAA family ATPase n=1 Tax=Gorillibacterium massiliense TaxID=1280390 RepID=UPI0004B070BE|nr:AAA family ATPase [Gorillibacterium massiliense]
MVKLVFFVGVAGTGKTTVARKLVERMPVCFIDRDTVGGRFVEAMLENAGLDKDDRDSSYYKEKLRDLEYDTAKDICIENLGLRQNVFMISPFTAELKSAAWLTEMLAAAGLTQSEVDVKVVAVTLANADKQRERIIERNTDRDEWKLEHWDEYAKRIQFVPEIKWDIPEENVLIFDNSGDLTEEKVDRIAAFIGL